MWGDSLIHKYTKLLGRCGKITLLLMGDIFQIVTKYGDKGLYVVDFPAFLCHHPVFKPLTSAMVVETHSKSTFLNELDGLVNSSQKYN